MFSHLKRYATNAVKNLKIIDTIEASKDVTVIQNIVLGNFRF